MNKLMQFKCQMSIDCTKRAKTYAYSRTHECLLKACREHLCVYRVSVKNIFGFELWQAEDEMVGLAFARRSSFKLLAVTKMLHDQRVALKGRNSFYQWYRQKTSKWPNTKQS